MVLLVRLQSAPHKKRSGNSVAEYSRKRFVVQLPSPDRPSPTYFNLALKGWGRRFESAPDRKRNGQGGLTSERNNSVTLFSCSITIVNFLL